MTFIIDTKFKGGWVFDWVPVKKLAMYDRLVMKHMVLKDKCSENLQDKFTKRSKILNYSTRNSRGLHLPKLRLEFTKNSFDFKSLRVETRSPNNIETTHP